MKGQESGLWNRTHSNTGIELREVGFGSEENVRSFLLFEDLAVN